MKIYGTVVHGKQLGRRLGFPTANLQMYAYEGEGPDGVYAAWFRCGGREYGCMVNIGRHPTLPEGEKTIEAHIFDFSEDIYGKQAELETVAYLRGEIRFPSVDALAAQLAADKQRSLNILALKD